MGYWEQVLTKASDPWAVVGFTGQFMFGLRFFVQWIVSERAGRVSIPVSFWYLSFAGSLITLVYAFVRADPVFMLATPLQLLMYTRNLMLLFKGRGERFDDQRPVSDAR